MRGLRLSRTWIGAMALVAIVSSLALAHARLLRSSPAAGEHVGQPPTELRLAFSESVSARTARLELVAPDPLQYLLDPRGEKGSDKVLLASVPPLVRAGAYRVNWRLIGPDGHAVTGSFEFVIDSVPRIEAPAADTTPNVVPQETDAFSPGSALQVVGRFLSALTVTLFIGISAFMLLVLPRARTSDAPFDEIERTARSWSRTAALALIVIAAGRLLMQGAALSGSVGSISAGDVSGIVAGTSWGRAWLGLVASAAAAILMLRTRSSDDAPWRMLILPCVGFALASPFLGHPAAAPNASVAIVLDGIHVAAAGGWAGSIVVLGLVAIPRAMKLQLEPRANVIRSMLKAYSPVALTCATLLLVTGGIGALLQMGSVSALWNTSYGMSLVRKLVLVAVVGALGAWHWRGAQPSLGSDRSMTVLRWSMALDVLAVLGVLVLTAVLTGTAPPTDLR